MTRYRWIAFLLSLGASSPSHAIELDYYTYNGFDATVNAFQRIALIFGSTDYMNLAFIVVVLGIFFGAFAFAGKAFLQPGQAGNPLSWFFLVMLGVAMFRALIIPTGTVHVYDPVRNAYQAVGNVPDLVVLVAGGMNKFERTAVELFDDAAAYPYAEKAGGISFQLLLNAMTDYSGGIDDQYLVKSLKRYYSDCSQMALIQASYDFDLNQLRSGTNDFMTLLPKLKSPADYTVVFNATPTGKGGISVTCESAWDDYLHPAWVDSSLYVAAMHSVCTRSGFNVAEATQLTRCQSLLADINLEVFDFVATPEHFLRQAAMANAIASAIQDDNPDLGLRALSNRAVMVEGIGVAQSANEWLPTIRAVVLAIVLGLFPLLVVFMVTPLFTRALAAMFGLFAWITLWGIADALVHHSAMDIALAAANEIKRHNMGLTAMLQSPEAAMQSLAIFGKARGMGITIASLLSVMLFRLSAAGLAGITASWQARVDSAGAQAATQTQTPEGAGGTLDRLAGGAASAISAGMMGYGRFATATAFGQQASLEGQSQLYREMQASGHSLASAAGAMGAIDAGARMGNYSASRKNVELQGGDPNAVSDLFAAARSVSGTEQLKRFGDSDAHRRTAGELGFSNVQEMSAFVAYTQALNAGTDMRTHSANAQRFGEAHQAFTGSTLSDGDAFQLYSKMRMADVTGRVDAFDADSDKATAFFGTSQALQQHQLDGLLAGAEKLGVSAIDLAGAGGRLSAARQQGDAQLVSSMTLGDIALGNFANQVMSVNSGTEMARLMDDRALITGTQELIGNELQLRHASSEVLNNVAASLNWPKEQTALAMQGANVQLAVGPGQMPTLPDTVIDPVDKALVGDGGLLSMSVGSDGAPVDNAQFRSGRQVGSDDSTFFNQGVNVTPEAAGSLLSSSEGQALSSLLRRTHGDTQSTIALQRAQAGFLSEISQSNLAVSESKNAGGSTGIQGLIGTPMMGLTGTGVSVTAEGHLRYDATVTDTDQFDANLARVRTVWQSADQQANQVASAWEAEQVLTGQPSAQHQRQDVFFEAKASAIHAELSELVSGDLANLDQATRNPVIGAERVNNPAAGSDRQVDIDDAIRRSRDSRSMGSMK